jgi:hypothetical protein
MSLFAIQPKVLRLRGGAYSAEDLYLAGQLPRDVYRLPHSASLNDCQRAMQCHPIEIGASTDHLFFCQLETFGCTEGHDSPWQISEAEDARGIVRRFHRFPRAIKIFTARQQLQARDG